MKIKDYISLINNMKFKEVLEYFAENAQKSSGKKFVVSINPEIIMLARKDSEFETVLKSADLALNDGVGVSIAARLFGKGLSGRVHGSDLVENVCLVIAKQPITVGFLGGKQNVAERASNCLKEKSPNLKVAFAKEEPGSNLKDLSCDILFVAFGSPKQEKWIHSNLPDLKVKVVMGVGGAFDFISGVTPRAPIWIRKSGLEWLFRLIMQPWRIKRQLALPAFVLLVLKESLR
jgi:N-acetylglucosaminyldiphosphoundecaprenol N-acetyl-beta-D-mannosaminyltransferase